MSNTSSPHPAGSPPEGDLGHPVLGLAPLGFPWPTLDPFLFCVHHDDHYPRGDGRFGPAVSLAGRDLGQDFSRKDGWSMYHGRAVPGFPQHPHRGFETVTVVRRGLLDHADSLGAAARYGQGDVQWLTAGAGVNHSEMFPLLREDADNPLELFQIWLNLPARDKHAEPHFTMLWDEQIPRVTLTDAAGRATVVTVAAGVLGEARPPAPPPRSWGSRPESDLAIWTVAMEAGASATLPAARPGSQRVLYFFAGEGLRVAGQPIPASHAVQVVAEAELALEAQAGPIELLVLQGRPIGEPVAQYGPFVMNTQAEIQQAFADYRRTGFGGWPWPSEAPVHGAAPRRFARRPTAAGVVEETPPER